MIRIYADMVGDLFHRGHVEMLKAARALGDFLIVGVLSDSVVASYKRLPVMSMEERVAVIGACRYVDHHEGISTTEIIRRVLSGKHS